MLDQLVVGAAPGDAITRNAVLVRDSLRALGPSELYANFIEPGVPGGVRHLSELADRPNRSRPLVFHASIGCWPVLHEIEDLERDLILVYHNISPAEPFARFAPAVADDLLRGRWELERLRGRVRTAIAVSEFNAAELRELGYDSVLVVPPTPDVHRLEQVVPSPEMLGRISSWHADPLVLTVAQWLPHKRLERTLAAVAVLQQEFLPSARLALVGVERFADYAGAVRSFGRSVGLAEPQFLGRVTDEELAALYLRAEVFCTLSEHEGFCVPLVEAMALGVPVVASARAAIPDTVGVAGVLLEDPDDPVVAAGVLHQVLTDPELRHLMVGRGVSRAKELSSATSLPLMVDALLGALGRGPVVDEVARGSVG